MPIHHPPASPSRMRFTLPLLVPALAGIVVLTAAAPGLANQRERGALRADVPTSRSGIPQTWQATRRPWWRFLSPFRPSDGPAQSPISPSGLEQKTGALRERIRTQQALRLGALNEAVSSIIKNSQPGDAVATDLDGTLTRAMLRLRSGALGPADTSVLFAWFLLSEHPDHALLSAAQRDALHVPLQTWHDLHAAEYTDHQAPMDAPRRYEELHAASGAFYSAFGTVMDDLSDQDHTRGRVLRRAQRMVATPEFGRAFHPEMLEALKILVANERQIRIVSGTTPVLAGAIKDRLVAEIDGTWGRQGWLDRLARSALGRIRHPSSKPITETSDLISVIPGTYSDAKAAWADPAATVAFLFDSHDGDASLGRHLSTARADTGLTPPVLVAVNPDGQTLERLRRDEVLSTFGRNNPGHAFKVELKPYIDDLPLPYR